MVRVGQANRTIVTESLVIRAHRSAIEGNTFVRTFFDKGAQGLGEATEACSPHEGCWLLAKLSLYFEPAISTHNAR